MLRGVATRIDLISDALPLGGLWYAGANALVECNRVRPILQPLT